MAESPIAAMHVSMSSASARLASGTRTTNRGAANARPRRRTFMTAPAAVTTAPIFARRRDAIGDASHIWGQESSSGEVVMAGLVPACAAEAASARRRPGTAAGLSPPGAVLHDVAHQVVHVVLQIPDDVLDHVSDRDHAHDLARVQHWQMADTAPSHHCHAALQPIVRLNRHRVARVITWPTGVCFASS